MPVAGIASVNFVVYRAIRDIVERLAFGSKVANELLALLQQTGQTRIPLAEFIDHLRSYLGKTRKSIPQPRGWLRRKVSRLANGAIFLASRLAIKRIARDCLVDGEVDLERFAKGAGESADQMVIRYLKTLLWDCTRGLIAVVVPILWLMISVMAALTRWLSSVL